MSLSYIQQLVIRGGATRVDDDFPIWDLAAPRWLFLRSARRFEALQLDIMTAAVNLPERAHLVAPESPQVHEVHPDMRHVSRDTWSVDPTCDMRPLLHGLLRGGGWYLYAAFRAVEAKTLPDSFQCDEEELARFALAHGVTFLLHAYADNKLWRMWIERELQAEEAAA